MPSFWTRFVKENDKFPYAQTQSTKWKFSSKKKLVMKISAFVCTLECIELINCFSLATQTQTLAQQLLFHRENGLGISINTSASTRIKIFPFSCAYACGCARVRVFLMKTNHRTSTEKPTTFGWVGPVIALALDSQFPLVWAFQQNGGGSYRLWWIFIFEWKNTNSDWAQLVVRCRYLYIHF